MIVVFDLETKALAGDMAPDGEKIGWSRDRLHHMGVSVASAWDSKTGRIFSYFEDGLLILSDLIDQIEDASLVVTYNGSRFDLPLLEDVMKRKIRIDRHVDLLQVVYLLAGKRFSLDAMCEINLGEKKSGVGTDAPALWRSGRIDDLIGYCEYDVMLTKKLFFHAWGFQALGTPCGVIDLNVDSLKGERYG
jgi:DEAD/DEAH box helicase domain-containing protein